jgi:hypothetical protein
MDSTFLSTFGYSQKWLECEILAEDYFNAQIEDHQTTGHTGWEHYRFGAFIHWIKNRNSATNAQINYLVELSLTDDDPLMGQSAKIELLKATWITDGQFEIVARAL